MKLVGKTFTGSSSKEALEIVGAKNVIIRRCIFRDGKTLLRLTDCSNVIVDNCMFLNPLGPPDPDGQAIQFIRSTGTISGCHATASDNTEDIFSIFSDKPISGTVSIISCVLNGRGKSQSGTSICLDGAFCPSTVIQSTHISGARCGITIAGGQKHTVDKAVTFSNCDTEIYVHKFYDGPFGSNNIQAGKVIM